MEEFIRQFILDEVSDVTYEDLWNFVRSNSVVRGSFEGQGHMIMKISSVQFVIYRLSIGEENTK